VEKEARAEVLMRKGSGFDGDDLYFESVEALEPFYLGYRADDEDTLTKWGRSCDALETRQY
jgi:hypothetical protein